MATNNQSSPPVMFGGQDYRVFDGKPDPFGIQRAAGPPPTLPTPPTPGQIPVNPISNNAQGAADIASLLGSYAGAEANNRYTRGGQTQSYDQLMLNAEGNRRTNESDALRKLAVTDYLQTGGHKYTGPSIMMNGQSRQLPTFGFGPTGVSENVQGGAKGLEGQLLARMQPGGSYTPTDPSTYTEQGTGEKIANIGGLIVGGLGAYDTITGGNGISQLMSKVGLGGGGSTAAATGGAAATAAGTSSPIIAGALNGLTPAQNAAGIASMSGSGLSGGAGTAGAGLAGSLGAAGAGAGLALGYNIAENGLFRGGEEGIRVNPHRDSFSQKFVQKFGGDPYSAMVTALASKGIQGPAAEQIIRNLYAAQDMDQLNQAYMPFIQAGLGDVFVTTAADSYRQGGPKG